jgi:2-methylaconitate cis-trans-isomerase PrpF
VCGAIAAATASLIPGSVAHQFAQIDERTPDVVEIEHPSGSIEIALSTRLEAGRLTLQSAGAVRTARVLFAGTVFVPTSVWPH